MNINLIRLYLDNCCLNRPFDDPSQERVRIEAEAVLYIMGLIQSDQCYWVGSEVVIEEVEKIRDGDLKEQIQNLLEFVHETIVPDEAILERSLRLKAMGLKDYDSLHLACAERGNVELLLTTDDQFLRRVQNNSSLTKVRVENPYAWMQESINKHAGGDEE